jgi:adenosine kinase
MKIALTGSIAFDYLMTFPGRFRDCILPGQIDRISLSFLVDSIVRLPGGAASNIAYTLALLGENPWLLGCVGEDFSEELARLESLGVITSQVRIIPDALTASFFATTDQENAQIASFAPGAMAYAAELHIADLEEQPDLLLVGPDDPRAMETHVEESLQLKIPYAYDPSQQIIRLSSDTLRRGIEGSHILFGNDYEYGLIEEKTGLSAQHIVALGKIVVITKGEAGVDLYAGESMVHVPAVKPRRIVDPTGAGDAFRGGFLKGHLNELSLQRCGQMGVLAATYCLEHKGPQAHAFSLARFISRFRRHFDDGGELDALRQPRPS